MNEDAGLHVQNRRGVLGVLIGNVRVQSAEGFYVLERSFLGRFDGADLLHARQPRSRFPMSRKTFP